MPKPVFKLDVETRTLGRLKKGDFFFVEGVPGFGKSLYCKLDPSNKLPYVARVYESLATVSCDEGQGMKVSLCNPTTETRVMPVNVTNANFVLQQQKEPLRLKQLPHHVYDSDDCNFFTLTKTGPLAFYLPVKQDNEGSWCLEIYSGSVERLAMQWVRFRDRDREVYPVKVI